MSTRTGTKQMNNKPLFESPLHSVLLRSDLILIHVKYKEQHHDL